MSKAKDIAKTTGQILDFRVGEPHALMALEDNTRIFNILKKYNGVPNDYNDVEVTDG